MKHLPLACVFAVLFSLQAFAQTALYLPGNTTEAVKAGSRTLQGVPGARYWQNGAAYAIDVHFDPATRVVSGTEKIMYYNNSPDTLDELHFKLYPNMYQRGARRDQALSPEDLTDGVLLTDLVVGAKSPAFKPATGTNLIVSVDPVKPHDSVQVSLRFSFPLNKGSHVRGGQVDSSSFFIPYFFPRIAVYDDIDGWNRIPYTGDPEFYNDFCHFSVSITVPPQYVVWATGDLKNPGDVLEKKYIDRIALAEKTNSIVDVIGPGDLKRNDITKKNPQNTWKFEAADVTDFVFALSDHYCWKSSSLEVDKNTKRRTRVDAAYNPAHKDFEAVAAYARKTVDFMSYRFPKWPYPYAHETVFDGLGQMEYPMMVNDVALDNPADAIELTDHEIFHTMFPFYMGINETKYGWMDEGWATIGEWLLSPMIDSSIEDGYGMAPYERAAGKEDDDPIVTLTNHLSGGSFFLDSYVKPGLGYLYVKDMLGNTVFFRALHFYIEHWHGKHPTPPDFFQAMNAGAGKNMDWFWKRWFYDSGFPDLSIRDVSKTASGYRVLIESIGTKPVPIDLRIDYASGKQQTIHRDVSCWERGNRTVVLDIPTKEKGVKMKLGSLYIPDVNKMDNEYVW